MSVRFVTDDKIAETSSKGNQEKWEEDGRWYKLDQFGYEALAEVFAAALLERSSLERDTPFTFVRYRMERVNVHDRERTGCSSENFLRPGESIVTLSHLYKCCLEKPLRDVLTRLSSDRKRIAYLAEMTAEITGLNLFPQYLTLLFETDALILNDDRHLNNIAVLERGGRFNYCPIFDNGAGLLSNTQLSPMDIAPAALIKEAKACPFYTTFNRQIIAARELYGPQLYIQKFTRGELRKMLQPMLEAYAPRDRSIITDRVCETVLAGQRLYK
jgi:hypothetical protein